MDKINILKIKSPDNWNYLDIFFVYSPPNHYLAHLWEHLLFRKLSINKDISIEKANTGSGIVNIRLKSKKKLNDIENILEVERKNEALEKERIKNELKEIIEEKKRLFYQFLQNQDSDIFWKIEESKLPSEVLSIFNFKSSFIIVAEPDLKKESIDFENFQAIEPAEDQPTDLIKNKKPNFCQLNFKVEIDNELEANLLLIFLSSLNLEVKKKMEDSEIYRIYNDLFKGYSKNLFFNFSFFGNSKEKLREILEIVETIKVGLNEDYRKELTEDLKENKKNRLRELEDKIWQLLEWGSYIKPKKQIEKTKSLTEKELNSWWENKKLEFFKVQI